MRVSVEINSHHNYRKFEGDILAHSTHTEISGGYVRHMPALVLNVDGSIIVQPLDYNVTVCEVKDE